MRHSGKPCNAQRNFRRRKRRVLSALREGLVGDAFEHHQPNLLSAPGRRTVEFAARRQRQQAQKSESD